MKDVMQIQYTTPSDEVHWMIVVAKLCMVMPLLGALWGLIFGWMFDATAAAFLAWSGLGEHGIVMWQVGLLGGFARMFLPSHPGWYRQKRD